MGLGNNKSNRTFISISNGCITRKVTGQDAPETFEFVEGALKEIRTRITNIKGSPTEFLDFLLEDNGEIFDLSLPLNGGTARSIVLSLSSVESFIGNTVRITPYLSKDGQHTNVSVNLNGQRLGWVTTKIPQAEKRVVGSQTVTDDSKRMAFINNLLAQLRQRVALGAATPQAQVVDEDGIGIGDDDIVAPNL